MTDQVIASIEKNQREALRVSLTQFKGHNLVDLRVYADDGNQQIPTPKGVTFKPSLLAEVIEALQLAEEQARLKGFITENRREAANG